MIEDDTLINGLIEAVGALPDTDMPQVVAVADLAARHLLAQSCWRLGATATSENLTKTLLSRVRRTCGIPIPEHLRRWLLDLGEAARWREPQALTVVGPKAACHTHLLELRAAILTALRS